MSDNESNWSLSKNLPITFIFGLLVQGAAIVWTVSMMMSDISNNALAISDVKVRVFTLEKSVQEQAVSLARIDENIKAIRMAVEAMATK